LLSALNKSGGTASAAERALRQDPQPSPLVGVLLLDMKMVAIFALLALAGLIAALPWIYPSVRDPRERESRREASGNKKAQKCSEQSNAIRERNDVFAWRTLPRRF